MDPSAKYAVPERLALLYDFLNSVDLRRYVESGCAHQPNDEFSSREKFDDWMRRRGLVKAETPLKKADYADALRLRHALRSFIEIEPSARAASCVASQIEEIATRFPLVVCPADSATPWLVPQPGSSRLGVTLVQFYNLAQSGELDRLKTCVSDDCKWIFFDRSKPGNRRWCSSLLCGNREKTRRYRERSRYKVTAS